MNNGPTPILDIRNLSVSFPIRQGFLGKDHGVRRLVAVDGVSFTLEKGTVTGIVGESGCGKTTLARTIARFQHADSGSVFINSTDLFRLTGKNLRRFRRHVQMIFQNPFASLDPRMTIKTIIDEAINCDGKRQPGEGPSSTAEYLVMTGLDAAMQYKYPHEFSGGQRQRIAIARALAAQASVIIADEPVSSLDVSVAAQILNLFSELRTQLDLSMLFISHDLAVVRFISQHILIMYQGRVVESGPTAAIFSTPLHPYTINLLRSVPEITDSPSTTPFFETVSGKEPTAEQYPGCAYAPRCDLATDQCKQEKPLLHCGDEVENHYCACFFAGKAG